MAHVANANRSRSPSPNAARSQSPAARAADAGKPAKKEKAPWVNTSASKNTAFGSPSDIHQRNLGSKGGPGGSSLRASIENDENERDLIGPRPNKARSSPAAAPLNAAKNFMSPTISTSSKVAAASPRRRVLSERNDDTRSSLTSLSDFSDFTELEENTVNMAAVVGSRPESGGTRPRRSSDLEESLSSVSVTQTFHAAPPLEEDPSLPPYDPQNNYLSPRPRFLRYRPRPRMEYHFGEVERGLFSRGEGEQLEERFSSESSAESGGLTEEIQSLNEQNACGDESNLSEQKIVEEVKKEEEEETHDAIPSNGMPLPSKEGGGEEEETRDAIPSSRMPLSSKEEGGEEETDDLEPKLANRAIPSKDTPKPRLFTRPRFLKFLFLMAVACVFASVIRHPTTGSSAFSALNHGTLRNLPLRVPDDPHIGDFLHSLIHLANGFDGLAGRRFRDWSLGSFAHFQMLLAQFAATPVEEFGFSYLNGTTARLEDLNAVEIKHELETLPYDFPDLEAEESSDALSLTENIDTETEGLGTPAGQDLGVDISREADTADGYESVIEDEIISERGERVSLDDDSDNLDALAPVQTSGEEELRGSKIEGEPDLLPETRDFVLPQTDEVEIYQEAEVDDGGSHGPGFPLQNLLALSSVVLALAALLVSLRVGRQQQQRQLVPASACGKSPPSSKLCSHPSPAQSHLPEAVTMVGESGPSELSSSLQNAVSSLGKRRPRRGAEPDDTTFSHERDLRRDSVASSTSFGSFTTYERLSAKKGDDALTPVRRSSRIRSQLTSP